MSRATDVLGAELQRQVAWLQEALASLAPGTSELKLRALRFELEQRLGMLALLMGRTPGPAVALA